MGRIRTRWIKTIGKELMKKYPDKFGPDFEKNKNVLKEMNIFESKSMRNKVAGYLVRLAKRRN
ncbi:MAG: 30S ribosomal protein S17e [Candidatus Micrarchaeota archaeon]|nr:30S ribosomal protein S17e [Candidatus Micrarchaeota archaeon]